ncbi:unnamed protein product [Sphagnum balticum]
MEALRSVVAVAFNHTQPCHLPTTVTWQTLNLIYKSCNLHLVLFIGQGGNIPHSDTKKLAAKEKASHKLFLKATTANESSLHMSRMINPLQNAHTTVTHFLPLVILQGAHTQHNGHVPRQLVVSIPVSPSLEDMSITQVVLIVVLIPSIKSLWVQACLVMEYAVQYYIHNVRRHKSHVSSELHLQNI